MSDFESKVHYIGSLYLKQEAINQSMRLNYRHNSAILMVACLCLQQRSLENEWQWNRKRCFSQLV